MDSVQNPVSHVWVREEKHVMSVWVQEDTTLDLIQRDARDVVQLDQSLVTTAIVLDERDVSHVWEEEGCYGVMWYA